MQRLILTAASACLVLVLCSCGAGLSSVANADADNSRLTATLDTATSINAAGVQLALTGTSDNAILSATGMANTKALFGQVNYDPASMHYVGSTPLAGSAPDQLLTMVLDQPRDGNVVVALVITDIDNRPGLNGDQPLFKLNFAPGAADTSRTAAAAPTNPRNAITLAGTLDANNVPTLTWQEQCAGDGDNNGEVNAADLVPLSKFYKKPFNPALPADSPKADADYDSNGEINGSDITVISQNFKITVGGYRIRTSTDGTTFVDFADVPRDTMFPAPVPQGILTWNWTGAALTADTFYQVEPYDRDDHTKRGLASANQVKLHPTATTITYTNIKISFNGADTWPANRKAGNGDYIVLLTENSIDGVADNDEPFSTPELQLVVTAEDTNAPGVPIDITNQAYMGLSEGGGLAAVSLVSASRGKLTFKDRGKITVQTFAPGDFTQSATISFELMSIQSLAITSATGASPQGISGGGKLQFVATGTFDFDGQTNGNEIQQDVTAYCAWGGIALAGNVGNFELRPDIGAVAAGTAQSGDSEDIYVEFPPTDNVKLYDNQKRSAGPFTVMIN